MNNSIVQLGLGIAVLLSIAAPTAWAAEDMWIGGGGYWTNLPIPPGPVPGQSTWWSLLHPPGTSDSATFNIPTTNTTIVTATPSAFEDLSLTAGALTLESEGDGFIPNLNVTSTTAGTQTISVSGASTALNLGTSNALSSLVVNTNTLNVQSGATVKVLTGSQLNTSANSLAGGALINGTVIVDGTGAKFTSGLAVTNTDQTQVGSGGTGALTFQAGSGGTIAGALGIADAASASNGTVTIKGSSTVTLKGSLRLSTQGVSSANATLNIDNASLDQQDFNFVTDVPTGVIVGSNLGTATLNVGTTTSGGSLSTGSLGLTINQNGAVNVGSGTTTGTLSVNGGLTVTGGGIGNGLSVQAGSSLNFASSFLTVQSGGQVVVPSYVTSFSSTTAITGASAAAVPSRISASTGFVSVNNNGAVHLTSGGVLTAFRDIDVANSGSGTMTADGIGSAINADGGTSSFSSFWGLGGNTATVTLSNAATASFSGGIDLAKDTTSGTNANVTVQSGAKLSAGNLTLASVGGATTSANLTITGAGSAVALNPFSTLTVGSSTTGTATINVNSGGSLSLGSGGITTLNPTGTINVNGGSIDLKTIVNNGGHLNVVTGSVASDAFTAGPGGALGTDPTIATGQVVTVAGDTTVAAAHTLTLDGGELSTGGMNIHGSFLFNNGILDFTRDGAVIDTAIVSATSNTTINFKANNVEVGKADDPTGFKLLGKLDVGDKTATIKSGGEIDLGGQVSVGTGGTLNLTSPTTSMLSGETDLNHGTIVASHGILFGTPQVRDQVTSILAPVSSAERLQARMVQDALASTIKDIGSKSEIGEVESLRLQMAMDRLSKMMATLANILQMTSQTASGITSNLKSTIQADTETLGTFVPGGPAGIGAVHIAGAMNFNSSSTLALEFAGTGAGQFDTLQIDSAVHFQFGARLALSLLDPSDPQHGVSLFAPKIGDVFDVLSAPTIDAELLQIQAPTLPGLQFAASVVGNSSGGQNLRITVVPGIVPLTGIPGDYNNDGIVDAADYTVWRDFLGEPTLPLLNDDTDGVGADDYTRWKMHYGQITPSTGAAAGSHVPEPTSRILLIIGSTVVGFLIRRCA